MTLSIRFYAYHFVRAILSIPFCTMPFCPYTILSIPFCSYHFVRYHFVLESFLPFTFIQQFVLRPSGSQTLLPKRMKSDKPPFGIRHWSPVNKQDCRDEMDGFIGLRKIFLSSRRNLRTLKNPAQV